MKTAREFELLRRAIEGPCPYCDDGLTDQDCNCPEYPPKLRQFAAETVEALAIREKQVKHLIGFLTEIAYKCFKPEKTDAELAAWREHMARKAMEPFAAGEEKQ